MQNSEAPMGMQGGSDPTAIPQSADSVQKVRVPTPWEKLGIEERIERLKESFNQSEERGRQEVEHLHFKVSNLHSMLTGHRHDTNGRVLFTGSTLEMIERRAFVHGTEMPQA